MNLDQKWGVVGVAFTLVTAITGILITIISISDSLTRLIGIAVFLISIGALLAIYWKLRPVKEIIYDVISDTRVVTIDEEVKGKVQVLFNGKPVNDARLVVLSISKDKVYLQVNESKVAMEPLLLRCHLEWCVTVGRKQASIDVRQGQRVHMPSKCHFDDWI